MRKLALLYEKLEGSLIHCYLCSHHCRIAPGKSGFCSVRQNINGVLYTHAYGKLAAAQVDPIEKKPLNHFLPGSFSFSIAALGCNFRCGFCQNWQISQRDFQDEKSTEAFSPQEIVDAALKNECKSVSYTYTEPTIFFEYALETAKLAREKGLYNIFVTNGYMTKECLQMIKPYLDAANVDLKFFRNDSYRRICSGSLEPVLGSIRLMKEMGIWVELTTLVIPGENDSKEELTDIANFISALDKSIPWHVSRFHPDYKFTGYEATSEDVLRRAVDIGHNCGLSYVYAGNTYGWGSDTFCPNCKKLLIRREGLGVLDFKIKEGRCPFCNTTVAGVF